VSSATKNQQLQRTRFSSSELNPSIGHQEIDGIMKELLHWHLVRMEGG